VRSRIDHQLADAIGSVVDNPGPLFAQDGESGWLGHGAILRNTEQLVHPFCPVLSTGGLILPFPRMKLVMAAQSS
jgi:hypothetical protein